MTDISKILDGGDDRARRAADYARGYRYTVWVQEISTTYELPAMTHAVATQMATNLTARPALDVVAASVRRVDPEGGTRALY